jgi:hypothetical protein
MIQSRQRLLLANSTTHHPRLTCCRRHGISAPCLRTTARRGSTNSAASAPRAAQPARLRIIPGRLLAEGLSVLAAALLTVPEAGLPQQRGAGECSGAAGAQLHPRGCKSSAIICKRAAVMHPLVPLCSCPAVRRHQRLLLLRLDRSAGCTTCTAGSPPSRRSGTLPARERTWLQRVRWGSLMWAAYDRRPAAPAARQRPGCLSYDAIGSSPCCIPSHWSTLLPWQTCSARTAHPALQQQQQQQQQQLVERSGGGPASCCAAPRPSCCGPGGSAQSAHLTPDRHLDCTCALQSSRNADLAASSENTCRGHDRAAGGSASGARARDAIEIAIAIAGAPHHARQAVQQGRDARRGGPRPKGQQAAASGLRRTLLAAAHRPRGLRGPPARARARARHPCRRLALAPRR